jgi:putative membrane-bound dehydrogenase-like protein
MKNALVAIVLLPLLIWPSLGRNNTQDTANTINLNGHNFTLPAGFTIELVAGPPLVDRPISIDFDEVGRLYVTEVSGTNEKPDIQLQKKPHRVLRLESTKGDGKFEKRTIFADRMMFPEGILYYQGSVYVAAPPSIWKLTDTDGDGVADERVEWFQGKTLTGCANDLHGPYLGPDGWIYWGKGAFAKQTYERPGKEPFVTKAAHIFRARPDGTGVEPVMTGGMDNPVGVVFTPGGERIFDTTFLQYPGGGKRDGIIHAVYGGVYGKEYHDVIDSHPWTGPSLMPVLTHLGAAAPCGLHRYEAGTFGPQYQDNIFCCCFNMRKVTRHVLVPDGSTFTTQDSDFLVSDNVDFHPTDVIEDADGSLLIVDTGGWYKLCCPTTQLIKPEVLGGIYRVRRTEMPKVDDPRGLRVKWDNLTPSQVAKFLDDPRPFVRKRATEKMVDLAAKTPEGEFELRWPALSPLGRTQLVWALHRIHQTKPNKAIATSLGLMTEDINETVRQAAVHCLGLQREKSAVPQLVKLLKGPSMQNRRAAAEALGRIGDKTVVPALFAALAEPCDRTLEHSLIYALIEIGDGDAIATGLVSSNAAVRRATMIAMDQMPRSVIQAATVAPELASADPRMKEAAWWIAGRHPDWADTVTGLLRDRLGAKNLSPLEQEELARLLSKFASRSPVQALLAEQLKEAKSTSQARRTVLKAMVLSGVKQLPDVWGAGLTNALSSDDVEVVKDAIDAARMWRDPKQKGQRLAVPLSAVSNNPKTPVALRLSALAAMPGGLSKIEPAQLELLLSHLGTEQPVALRGTAADVLGRAKLNQEQLRLLIPRLKTIGPMEIDRVLEPFASASDEALGKELVAALQTASSKSSLRMATLKPRLAKFGPEVQKQAEELFASLNVDAGKQQAHLEKLLQTMSTGDQGRGQVVFNSQKAACFTCHAIGYRGGTVGPDLTHIARTRTERDLLEAVVFPNASFVRGYEPVQVTTKNGKVFNGVLKKDLVDEIVLELGADQQARIAREEIDDMRPSQVSVMPGGMDQLLTPNELADLVAFLKACK